MVKETFSIISIAALACLSSCSNDNTLTESDKNAIRFNTTLQGATRASVTESTFAAFNVTALKGSSVYFTNLGVNKQSDGSWATERTEKWPPDGSSLQFFAYAPTTLSSKVIISNTEQKLTGYTPDSDVDNQADVLTAYNSASGGTVQMTFKHALSMIEIKAQNSSTEGYEMKVKGVKLGWIPSTADMTFQNADAFPQWATPEANSEASYTIEGTPFSLTSSTQSLMFDKDNFLMIPQQLTAWNNTTPTTKAAYIGVLCQITNGSRNVYPTDPTKFAWVVTGINTLWEPGHKYVYTLDFFKNGGAGYIDPDDPDNPGAPVINDVPISFSVSIKDWINGTGDNITVIN